MPVDFDSSVRGLSQRLQSVNAKIIAEKSKRDEWKRQYRESVAGSKESKEQYRITQQAVDFLRAAADIQRKDVRDKIEAVVCKAVRAVFGSGVSFRLLEDVKRGQLTIEPQVGYRNKRSTEWVSMGNVGGGMADVVSFALRVTTLAMMRDRIYPIIIADEPFKWVSAEYLPNVAAMLHDLSHSIGIQMIIVSHEQEISQVADKVFVVEKTNGISELFVHGDKALQK